MKKEVSYPRGNRVRTISTTTTFSTQETLVYGIPVPVYSWTYLKSYTDTAQRPFGPLWSYTSVSSFDMEELITYVDYSDEFETIVNYFP